MALQYFGFHNSNQIRRMHEEVVEKIGRKPVDCKLNGSDVGLDPFTRFYCFRVKPKRFYYFF